MTSPAHPPVLVSLVDNEAVSFETLRERYGALLELVHTLLGVVPNCDPYLEIWPPAFRSYNVADRAVVRVALIAPTGWSPGKHVRGELPAMTAAPRADSLGKRFGVIRHAPAAVGFDKQWTQGVPDRWPAAGAFLREKVGHEFPVLGRIRHRSAMRAITTMIRDDFCESVVGKEQKLAAGLVHAEAVDDASLAAQLRAVGAAQVADSPVQLLARAVSPSPAAVDEQVVAACRALAPAAIIEIVTFIALLQLLHRPESYYKEN